MGDGLFWERKCCLSSEKQFPELLGLFLSSFFFFQGITGVGSGWVHLLCFISGCLSVSTFEVGSKNQICVSQLETEFNKYPYQCFTFHSLQP